MTFTWDEGVNGCSQSLLKEHCNSADQTEQLKDAALHKEAARAFVQFKYKKEVNFCGYILFLQF